MFKGTDEANCDGHFSRSHVKKFLWQETWEPSKWSQLTVVYQHLACISISSLAPAPSSMLHDHWRSSQTEARFQSPQKGPSDYTHLSTAILDSSVTITDVLTSRKLTEYRRWTKVTQGHVYVWKQRSRTAEHKHTADTRLLWVPYVRGPLSWPWDGSTFTLGSTINRQHFNFINAARFQGWFNYIRWCYRLSHY